MASPATKGFTPGRHVYDVIVVGGQLGGITVTALLARRGFHVLHIPHDGLGSPYAQGIFKLPHAPFILPPIKLLQALDEVLQELSLSTVVGRATEVVPVQFLQNDRRFELNHDEKRRGPELARAFGAEAESFDELMRKAEAAASASDSFFSSRPDLPPEGLMARWKFKRGLGRFAGLELDTPLPADALVRRLTPFVAALETPARLTLARTLGRTLAGPATFPGGREGLWQTLAERARELGADVLAAGDAVERMLLEGHGVGVRLGKNDFTYRATFVVAALDLDVLTHLVPDKARRAAIKSSQTVGSEKALFTLNWVMPERALPRGLGKLALVEAPPFDGGALLLQLGPGPQPDQRVLTISVPAPVSLRAAGEPAIRAVIEQIHGALAHILPFSRPHIILESTPWIDSTHLVATRSEAAPLFQLPAEAPLGVGGLTTHSVWKPVLLASRQVLPGLGLEGEILAAQRAVRVVETALEKRDRLTAKRPVHST